MGRGRVAWGSLIAMQAGCLLGIDAVIEEPEQIRTCFVDMDGDGFGPGEEAVAPDQDLEAAATGEVGMEIVHGPGEQRGGIDGLGHAARQAGARELE